MEYVEGRNLEEELAVRGEPLPEGLVIDIARQLCDVLAYLHGLNPPIIYRDMKPSNVMLNPNGRVVLVDFGIARLFKAARKGTMIGHARLRAAGAVPGQRRSAQRHLFARRDAALRPDRARPGKFPPFSFPPDSRVAPRNLEQSGRCDRRGARLRDERAARDDPGIPRHDALRARAVRDRGARCQFDQRGPAD